VGVTDWLAKQSDDGASVDPMLYTKDVSHQVWDAIWCGCCCAAALRPRRRLPEGAAALACA
jgi:hypothetical protein